MLQVYGLVPILSARENVSIALRARGVDPRDGGRGGRGRARPASASPTSATARWRSSPAARCSASPVPAASSSAPASCSPTSRPPSSTRATAAWCWPSCTQEAARGSVVVVATHDPAVVDACDRPLRARRGAAGAGRVGAGRVVPGQSGSGMTRSLRGAWSRRGALLTLLAMTTVVVGGAVGVLSFAEAAGTSRWLMSPLLLLGAVAVPSIGGELGDRPPRGDRAGQAARDPRAPARRRAPLRTPRHDRPRHRPRARPGLGGRAGRGRGLARRRRASAGVDGGATSRSAPPRAAW